MEKFIFKCTNCLKTFDPSLNILENLFSDDENFGLTPPQLQDVEPWGKDECLKHEKQLLGLYITSNPLEKYKNDLKEFANLDRDIQKFEYIRLGGIISNIEFRFDKKVCRK